MNFVCWLQKEVAMPTQPSPIVQPCLTKHQYCPHDTLQPSADGSTVGQSFSRVVWLCVLDLHLLAVPTAGIYSNKFESWFPQLHQHLRSTLNTSPKWQIKVKVNVYSSCATSLTTTGTHMPYGITVLPATRQR